MYSVHTRGSRKRETKEVRFVARRISETERGRKMKLKKFYITDIDTVIRAIRDKFEKQDILVFKLAVIAGFIVYFPFLTQWLGNPDSFWNGMLYKNGSDWENSQGRFGLTVLYRLKGYLISPTFVTFCSVILLAFICVLVKRIFHLNRLWHIIFTICFVVVTPNVISTMTYYYCSDSYFLAYFLIVAAVYCAGRGRNVKNYILASALIAAATSCYQAYIAVAAVLFLMVILQRLVQNGSLRETGKDFAFFIGTGITSMILYLGVFKLIQVVFGVVPASGKLTYPQPDQIIGLGKNAYRYFKAYFLENGFLYNEWYHRKQLNIYVMLILGVFGICYLIKKRPSVIRIIAIGFTFILMPPAFMLITIIAPNVNYYPVLSLQLPAMNYVYLLPVVLLAAWESGDNAGSNGYKLFEWVTGYVCFRIAVMLIVFTFAFTGYMQMNWNRMFTASVEIEKEIETLKSKEEDARIVFAGELPDFAYHNSLIDAVGGTTAESKMVWSTWSGRQSSWVHFLMHSVGRRYETIEEEEYQDILNTEQFANMPVFPADGFAETINGVIVIKLGNQDDPDEGDSQF